MKGMGEQEWIQKYFDERFSSLTTLMNARFEMVNDKLESIECHVRETNGRVSILECESDKRQKVVDDFHSLKRRILWFKKNWWLSLIILMFLIIIAHFIYDAGKFGELLKFLM